MSRYTWPLLCLLLMACGDDLVLPSSQPLQAEAEALDALYGAHPGPHQVTRVDRLEIAGANSGTLEASLYFPQQGEQFPLLLFSHGNWSDRHSYDRVIEYWVSHGYVVLAADHADCCSPVQGIFNSLRYGQLGLINRRMSELQSLLASIPELESRVEGFVGKADTRRVAAAGHSFGAFSAQQLGGASPVDPDTGEYHYQVDARISAVVALNPPGPMFDVITAESWRGLQLPTMVTTGTWEVQKGFWEDWRMHLMSWEQSPPGDKYALVIDGADHYLGNLICRTQREHPPQHDALRMVQISTVAFLDAQLKGIEQATSILANGAMERETLGYAKLWSR